MQSTTVTEQQQQLSHELRRDCFSISTSFHYRNRRSKGFCPAAANGKCFALIQRTPLTLDNGVRCAREDGQLDMISPCCSNTIIISFNNNNTITADAVESDDDHVQQRRGDAHQRAVRRRLRADRTHRADAARSQVYIYIYI